jgi:hypothetical protein
MLGNSGVVISQRMKFEFRGRAARTDNRIVLCTIRPPAAPSLRRSERSSADVNATLKGVSA